MEEVGKVRDFLETQLFGTILDSLTLFIFLPVMFFFNPVMTCVVLFFCALVMIWLIITLPAARRVTGAVIAAEVARGSFLYQNLQGMRTVKSLALETRQRRQWDLLVSRVIKLKLDQGFTLSYIQSVVTPLERLAVVGSICLGVYIALVGHDPVLIGSLFAYYMLSSRCVAPLAGMAKLVTTFDEARGKLAVAAHMVNQPGEVAVGGVKSPLLGHIEFRRLRFRYQGSQNYALDDVSFEIPIGGTLGVVGRSGSGKTTLTRLLQHLHAVYEGEILIDGVEARDYDVAHLRRNLGVVLQENYLFSGSIRDNITAAKPHATFEEIVGVARLSGAEEFIDRLPRGYETHIFEGSPNLSGGQRQRLAIARALLIDPKILILDEATSALDPDSEAIVNENIARIAEGRTVIVISHRLASLVNSDAILVLERGKFVDMGKHYELMERCEIYSGLWNQQNRHIAAASRPADARGPVRVS
jgi:ATP-binding cassette subfamily B protein